MPATKLLSFYVPDITGPCCGVNIATGLKNTFGLQKVSIHSKTVRVEVDKTIGSEEVLAAIHDIGYEEAASIPPEGYKEVFFRVSGFNSAADAESLRKKLNQLAYVSSCKVDYSTGVISAYVPWLKDLNERNEYLAKICPEMEVTLNDDRQPEERISVTVLKTPIKTQKTDDPWEFVHHAFINMAIFVPLLILSRFIPAPITLFGKLVGLMIGAITFAAMHKSGGNYYRHAWEALKNRRSPSMYTLIALGTSCAWLYSILLVFFPKIAPGAEYQFATANMVLFFVNLGQAARGWVSKMAEREVKNLTQVYANMQPQVAKRLLLSKNLEAESKIAGELTTRASDSSQNLSHQEQDNGVPETLRNALVETVPYGAIKKGDYVKVLRDTRVPVDGIILNEVDNVYANQEAISGKSEPCKKEKGDEVYSGSLITGEDIYVQAKVDGEEGRLHKLIEHAAKASEEKPAISNMIDNIAKIFAPSIILIASSAALFWLLRGYGLGWSINIFMSVLLCACPCALSLATPITMAICMYRLFNQGIFVKEDGHQVLEVAPYVDTIIFDKTGTLTTFEVADVFVSQEFANTGITKEKVLRYAASLEQSRNLCEHPIAQAFLARTQSSNLLECLEGKKDGEGVIGTVVRKAANGGRPRKEKVVIGRRIYIESKAIEINDKHFETMHEEERISCETAFRKKGLTVLYIAINGVCCGIVGLKQQIRKEAEETIKELRAMGLDLLILTGDEEPQAKSVANQLGIEKVHSEKTEIEKGEFVKGLKYRTSKNKWASIKPQRLKGGAPAPAERHYVLMIGDGVNDIPATIEADIGVALGSWAKVSASAHVTVQNLRSLATFLLITKETTRNIQQNLTISTFYNLVSVAIAVGILYHPFGLIFAPYFASAVMSIPSLLVILNALSLNLQVDFALKAFQANFDKKKASKPSFIESVLHTFPFKLLATLFAYFNYVKNLGKNNPKDNRLMVSPSKKEEAEVLETNSSAPSFDWTLFYQEKKAQSEESAQHKKKQKKSTQVPPSDRELRSTRRHALDYPASR